MSDVLERVFAALARGIVQACLEANCEGNGVVSQPPRPRRSRKPVAPEPQVQEVQEDFFSEADLRSAIHQGLAEEDNSSVHMDLEQVFAASRLARKELDEVGQTQPGPGEDESQSWLKM